MHANDSRKPIKKHGSTAVGPRVRRDSGEAFIKEPGSGRIRTRDALAETLAQDFLGSAIEGEPVSLRDAVVPEEDGGPFVTTDGRHEFAKGTDPSNPKDSEVEPFPSVSGNIEEDFDEEEEEEEQLEADAEPVGH
jgi:hypothetical protein